MSEQPLPQPERVPVPGGATATATHPVGVVAIGRNEGERLRRCLESVVNRVAAVVYVDSGSTDGSVELAESLGVEVVELDLSIPFTAARARNEGFARLQQILPGVEYVQMIDGDCEVVDGWLDAAVAALDEDDKLAVVCGRRRERFPDATVYNRLTDMEWDTPVGTARSCGGDALFRAAALREVGGYNPTVIAGEEPEMCVRLRQAGWLIERLDAEMTLHDAAMTKFSQWWRRNVRAGHAYAQGAAMHGKTDGHNVKQARSMEFWAGILPAMIIVMLFSMIIMPPWAPWYALAILVCLLGYPILALKIWLYRRSRYGDRSRDAALYAVFTVIGKFANQLGQAKFRRNRRRGRVGKIIEYKSSEAPAT
ncbi:MAG: glycosyltransferase [Planctomycetota bacterium]